MPLELFMNDVRSAVKQGVRRPGFTLLIVATLALGIGINSAMFALFDGVLLRPLPYRDPSRLVFVWQTLPSHNVFELEPTPFDYAAWRDQRVFDSVALITTDAFTIWEDGGGERRPERVRGARVTASLMPTLGVAPAIGRAFMPSEDSDAAAPSAILSDGLWRRRFGADPSILGRDVRVNGIGHTIVGVMPPTALLPGHLAGSSELWLPADERGRSGQRDPP